MSIIDLLLVAILVICFALGFFGTWQKKLIRMGGVVVSAVASYFLAGPIAKGIGNIKIKGVCLVDKFHDLLAKAPADGSVAVLSKIVSPTAAGIIKLGTFIALFVVLVIILEIVLLCLHKVFSKFEKKTGWMTFGLPSLVTSTITTCVLALPIFVAAPIARNAAAIMSYYGHENTIVTFISDQYSHSIIVDGVEYLLDSWHPDFLSYTDDDVEKDLHSELDTRSSLVHAFPLFTALKSDNALKALKEMDSDVFDRAISVLDANKDLLVELLPEEKISELGIDIETIDFNAESNYIKSCLAIIVYDEEGNLGYSLSDDAEKFEAEATSLANAMIESQLLAKVLHAGVFATMPEDFANIIKNYLQNASADAELLPEEKYNILLAYFEAVENEESETPEGDNEEISEGSSEDVVEGA